MTQYNDVEPQRSALRKEIELLCARLCFRHMLEDYDRKSQDPKWMSGDFETKVASLLRNEAQRRDANAVVRLRRESNLPAELSQARFCELVEDPKRKIDQNVLEVLRHGEWMTRAEPADLVITGACGVGKSYVAACCANLMLDRRRSVYFIRAWRLFQDLQVRAKTGDLESRKAELRKVGLLVLDDFLLEELSEGHVSELLDVINDRIRKKPTIFTSQFTMDGWLERLGDTPLSEAVVDRIRNSAYRLHLSGPSMRKPVSDCPIMG